MGTDVDRVAKRILPCLAVNAAVLIILSLFPSRSLWLPVRLGLWSP